MHSIGNVLGTSYSLFFLVCRIPLFYFIIYWVFFGLAPSPTTDRTQAPSSGSTESQPLDHQGSPCLNNMCSFSSLTISQCKNERILQWMPASSPLGFHHEHMTMLALSHFHSTHTKPSSHVLILFLLLLYSRSLLVIHFKYSSVYMSIPNSLTVPSPDPSAWVLTHFQCFSK